MNVLNSDISSNKWINVSAMLNPSDDLVGYIGDETAEAIGIESHFYSVWSHYNGGNTTQILVPLDGGQTPVIRVIRPSESYDNKYQCITNADFIDLTLNSGIVNASNNSGGRNKLGYCKIGDIVYIAGGIGITNFSGDITAVAQLPSGYRPATIHYYFAPLSGSRICRALVNQNGSIYVEWAKNINDGSDITGEITWIDLSTWFTVA